MTLRHAFAPSAFARSAFATGKDRAAFARSAFANSAFVTRIPPHPFAASAFSNGFATGRDSTSDPIDRTIDFVAEVAVGLQSVVAMAITTTFGGTIGVSLSSAVLYVSGTPRPIVVDVDVTWQEGADRQEGVASAWSDASRFKAAALVRYQNAAKLPHGVAATWVDSSRAVRLDRRVRFQDGQALRAGFVDSFVDSTRVRRGGEMRFERAAPLRRGAETKFQDGSHRVRQLLAPGWQDGGAYQVGIHDSFQDARPYTIGRTTRYQEARRPPPGRHVFVPPQPPAADPCYVPPRGDAVALVFSAPWTGSAGILFVCETHGEDPPPEPGATVVVPVRKIYTVINSATLRRVDGDVLIPTLSMSLTIDVDSWTWGFTARTPGAALPDLEPVDGQPIEVEATINGVAYRAIVEGLARERSFGRSDLNVTGRGLAAVLDSPYASSTQIFGNPDDARTVQQLANDVLTLNGVSMGWDLDTGWSPEDWSVPAGVWSHQGSYMSALNAIASAAGAYIQPHRTGKRLDFLRRYPAKPWEWDDVEPDFELPADVVSKESISWLDKPIYNRVFVRGAGAGVIGQVTRSGTEGDLEGPAVVDALIMTAAAARQRSMPVLCDVGRQALVSLRLPVLAETGVIAPGKFVRYLDGGIVRLGLVRSTSAEVTRADKKLTIWQTIGVETHVNV